jgi:hypothetical protein
MNDELEGIWKEAVMYYSRKYPDIYPEGLRITGEDLSQDSQCQTEHLPTTSQGRRRCASPFRIAASFSYFLLTGFEGFYKRKKKYVYIYIYIYSWKILRSSTTEYFSRSVYIKERCY